MQRLNDPNYEFCCNCLKKCKGHLDQVPFNELYDLLGRVVLLQRDIELMINSRYTIVEIRKRDRWNNEKGINRGN